MSKPKKRNYSEISIQGDSILDGKHPHHLIIPRDNNNLQCGNPYESMPTPELKNSDKLLLRDSHARYIDNAISNIFNNLKPSGYIEEFSANSPIDDIISSLQYNGIVICKNVLSANFEYLVKKASHKAHYSQVQYTTFSRNNTNYVFQDTGYQEFWPFEDNILIPACITT